MHQLSGHTAECSHALFMAECVLYASETGGHRAKHTSDDVGILEELLECRDRDFDQVAVL